MFKQGTAPQQDHWKQKTQMDFKFSVRRMILIFTICYSKCTNGSKLRIYRHERDIFTNLYYSSSQSERNYSRDSMKYNAKCYNITGCRYCECKDGTNTFIIDNNDKNRIGSCIKDEELHLEGGKI